MNSELVECAREDDIAIVTLNRPAKHNALNGEMFARLNELLDQFESEETLRVLLLTGAGERAFCAGTDIEQLVGLTRSEAEAVSKRGQSLGNRFELFPVPVIAVINGVAAGGGCELALACHLRFASTTAMFSIPEVKLGMMPAYGGSQRLRREIGEGRARELMLTGKTVGAREAFEIGLVNRVMAPDKLLDETLSFAHEISKLSASSIRACLKAVTQGLDLPLQEGLALETELFASLFDGEDVREGTTAFLEKREPVFNRRKS